MARAQDMLQTSTEIGSAADHGLLCVKAEQECAPDFIKLEDDSDTLPQKEQASNSLQNCFHYTPNTPTYKFSKLLPSPLALCLSGELALPTKFGHLKLCCLAMIYAL